jgi:hypothetical protein
MAGQTPALTLARDADQHKKETPASGSASPSAEESPKEKKAWYLPHPNFEAREGTF